jgi:DNA-binding beta-propeller fold protein YncE
MMIQLEDFKINTSFKMAIVLFVGMLSACASTEYKINYEVDPQTARIWPSPPEVPRYRYVGELTGEQNVREIEESKSFGTKFVDFFKMLVGIKGQNPVPVVLQRPQTGCIDDKGRILITDVSRHGVMVFDMQKGELSEWLNATPNTNFISPLGIAVGPKGSVYVSDSELNYVVQLDETGAPIKQIGEGLFKRPTGVAWDPAQGRLYVADTHGHDIKVFNDNGELIDVIGSRGTKIGEFNSPTHLAFANGNLYVTDTFNTRVQVLTDTGDFKREFGRRGTFVGDLVRPKGVTTDSDGNIYVIESLHDHLLVYNSKGDFLLPIGGTGTDIGQFYLPAGVWSDNQDRIYIADMFNGRIVILQYLGGKQASKTGQSRL